MASVYRSIFRAAAAAPNRACLLLDDGTTLTYGEMDDRAARVAGGLLERGLRPGDRVAAQVEKSPSAIALYLACLRTGIVYVPLNTAYTGAEVSFLVEDAGPGLFVDDEVLADLPGPYAPEVASRSGDDWAAMLYTSGTTGRPKGAMLSCRSLVSNARALHDAWGFSPDDVVLHALPVFHVHGLFVALHCAFLAGAAVRFHQGFDPDRVRADLRGSTVFMGVPTHYHRLLDQTAIDARDCAAMRLFTSGSAPLLAARHEEFATRTGHRIVERYGMTETMILTTNPYEGARVAGTVGYALDGVELRTGPDDVVEVRTDGIFLGYWGLPEQTSSSFRDGGWFLTGDVGSLDAEGRLTLAGRLGDLIITGGLNVYPAEVEGALDAVDGVRESAVLGMADDDLGEIVVAVVATDRTVDEDALRGACEHLARFKHPRRFVFVDRLPRNAMGKIQRVRLRAELDGRSASRP